MRTNNKAKTMEGNTSGRLRSIENRIASLEAVVDKANILLAGMTQKLDDIAKHYGERINKLESNQTWLSRLIIGFVITGVLVFLYKK